jgi:hypothetical protein
VLLVQELHVSALYSHQAKHRTINKKNCNILQYKYMYVYVCMYFINIIDLQHAPLHIVTLHAVRPLHVVCISLFI